MKLNRYTVIGLIYFTFWVSMAISEVGKTYDPCSEVNAWYFPIIVSVFLAPLFIAGYLGGNYKGKK